MGPTSAKPQNFMKYMIYICVGCNPSVDRGHRFFRLVAQNDRLGRLSTHTKFFSKLTNSNPSRAIFVNFFLKFFNKILKKGPAPRGPISRIFTQDTLGCTRQDEQEKLIDELRANFFLIGTF